MIEFFVALNVITLLGWVVQARLYASVCKRFEVDREVLQSQLAIAQNKVSELRINLSDTRVKLEMAQEALLHARSDKELVK